ncbi:hypothetical protein DORLON_01890 [Dorea longicatena DSM 13814]|uniref:Uncharacterized protein n=1 Tax=Dorea longicatena DSM 13814 TaxID=411462 RepID=A6BHW5_9FIRM|nr:hypothetical protein DORLON_01890 [Dorea longicatena DSM 13814]
MNLYFHKTPSIQDPPPTVHYEHMAIENSKKSTHPGGFEPPLPPPEGGALSPELRVRIQLPYEIALVILTHL